MKNYQLCKTLKDAGFPQEGEGTTHHINIDGLPEEAIYQPTLEELIEACGEIKMEIGNIYSDDWIAQKLIPNGHNSWKNGGHGSGSTPSEAIGNLYVALKRPEAPLP